LVVGVERDRAGAHLRVRRPGFLVALRRDQARAAGYATARLDMPPAGPEEAPIVWESTQLEGLETIRGTVRVDGRGDARVALVETPKVVAEESKPGHRCRAHEDGAGGFTVLCETRPASVAKNLTGDAPDTGVTLVSLHGRTYLRLDLPTRPERPDAFAVVYTLGNARVVVRAEGSIVAGEDEPSLALVSTERDQPVVVTVRFMPSMSID
jgi:hypothetical protein